MTTSEGERRRRVYTVEEAARLLGINRSTAYELAAKDKLPTPTLRLGKRLVVPMAPLDRLLGIEPAGGPHR